MNYATNIALIDRASNMVSNIIWGMIYQEEEFSTETEFAVVIKNLRVSIGDLYDGTNFYHEGEIILPETDILAALDDAYAEGVDSI